MSVTLELYDRARATIATRGFDAEVQTKIALFLGAAKSINAAILGAIELQPQPDIVYPFVHGQYFRELEFVSLLTRVTRWSANPSTYAEGAQRVAPLWAQWWQLQGLSAPFGALLEPRRAFAALALGHALLARVRLAPVIPANTNEMDPFVAALRRIEQEGGRMVQAQIRLLKDGPSPLPMAEREQIVEGRQGAVDEAFQRFLQWLSDGA